MVRLESELDDDDDDGNIACSEDVLLFATYLGGYIFGVFDDIDDDDDEPDDEPDDDPDDDPDELSALTGGLWHRLVA